MNRWWCIVALFACQSGTWTDTFRGTDTRSTSLGALPQDDGAVDPEAGPVDLDAGAANCNGLARSKATVPITVAFPGYEAGTPTIHVMANGSSCDVHVDTSDVGLLFASDALPCAALLAVGSPSQGQVTVTGGGAPNDMSFVWSYGDLCNIIDDYALSKP